MDVSVQGKFSLPIGVCTEDENKGIDLVSNSLNELFDKTLKGLSASMRIAALCYNSPEIRKMACIDQFSENWIDDISGALCALSHFDHKIRERILYSIRKAHEAYDIKDIQYRMEDINNEV